MHHSTSVLFPFKENSSSDNGVQASEDEGAALPVHGDDPGKESDADSSGATGHSTKLLDEAPPKSALKHTPARWPSITRGQCCAETRQIGTSLWSYCVVAHFS